MYQEKNTAIGHRNRNVKTENLIFTSSLTVSEKQPPFGDHISYQGEYYALIRQRIPYQRDKTQDEGLFYLTLFSIVKELERENLSGRLIQVNLPVGLPPKHYGGLYRRFEKYLGCDEIQNVTYRGKRYSFCINDVVTFSQDYAATMTICGKLKEYVKVIVIDLGGLTLDYLMLWDGQLGLGVCDSLGNGVIKLCNSISSRINAKYDVLLEETDVDQVILGKDTDYEPGIARIVQEMAETFTEDFLGSLRERNMDLKSGRVVFMGSGASLLERYIRNSGKVGKSIFIPELQANTKGYGVLYRLQEGR